MFAAPLGTWRPERALDQMGGCAVLALSAATPLDPGIRCFEIMSIKRLQISTATLKGCFASGRDGVDLIDECPRSDTEPLVDIFKGSGLKQLVYMSSAGVYLKTDEMPHLETQAVDPKSRHKGKLDTE
ncbi:unnamed protein product, partial [Prorocentrum cordatum]